MYTKMTQRHIEYIRVNIHLGPKSKYHFEYNVYATYVTREQTQYSILLHLCFISVFDCVCIVDRKL